MNRSSDPILSVYSDARVEYTKQLCVFLVPAYFQFFIDLLEKAKQSMSQEPKKILWQNRVTGLTLIFVGLIMGNA